jgi:hypothetical protein
MKGSAFRSTLAAIERVHGQRGLRAVLDALDPEARAALDHVLPVGFYPVSLAAALHEAIRNVLGFGSWEASRRLGHEAARIDYRGLSRLVLRAVHYDSVFARLEMIWRHYYTEGSFEWDHRREGFTRLTIRDARGFNEGMWQSVAGRAEELLRMTGSRAAEVALLDVSERSCTLEAMWLT